MFLSSASGICGECWLHIRLITTSRARTWRWRRMRRYGELSRGAERSSPRQFSPDCTIAMCGYDFREGQELYSPILWRLIRLLWRIDSSGPTSTTLGRYLGSRLRELDG